MRAEEGPTEQSAAAPKHQGKELGGLCLSPEKRLSELFSERSEWTRIDLLRVLGVGRYKTDLLLRDALSQGRIQKVGRTKAAVFRRIAPASADQIQQHREAAA